MSLCKRPQTVQRGVRTPLLHIPSQQVKHMALLFLFSTTDVRNSGSQENLKNEEKCQSSLKLGTDFLKRNGIYLRSSVVILSSMSSLWQRA